MRGEKIQNGLLRDENHFQGGEMPPKNPTLLLQQSIHEYVDGEIVVRYGLFGLQEPSSNSLLREERDTVEPLIKDTLIKGHLCIKDTIRCTNLSSVHVVFSSIRGQPLCNGPSQRGPQFRGATVHVSLMRVSPTFLMLVSSISVNSAPGAVTGGVVVGVVMGVVWRTSLDTILPPIPVPWIPCVNGYVHDCIKCVTLILCMCPGFL